MVACLIPEIPLAIKNSSINGLFCNAYSFQNVIFLTLISYHRFMPLHLIAFIIFIGNMIQFVVSTIRNFFGLFLKYFRFQENILRYIARAQRKKKYFEFVVHGIKIVLYNINMHLISSKTFNHFTQMKDSMRYNVAFIQVKNRP